MYQTQLRYSEEICPAVEDLWRVFAHTVKISGSLLYFVSIEYVSVGGASNKHLTVRIIP